MGTRGKTVLPQAAAVVVGVEALALLGLAGRLLVEVLRGPDPAARAAAAARAAGGDGAGRLAGGSSAYFLLLGMAAAAIAWGLWRCRRWAAGAATFLQLLALPIAWYMARGGFFLGAVPLAGGAVVALYGIHAPASRRAFGDSGRSG